VQYGARFKALAVYLSAQHFIPEDRLQQVFSDIFRLPVSTATLASINEEVAGQLEKSDQAQLDVLKTAAVKHLDETSLRIGGKTQWLHVTSNSERTHYRVSEKRGNLLTGVSGVVVHDHWKPYFTMEEDIAHALCNAHHLRELKALEEIEKEPWACKMGKLLRVLSRLKTSPPKEHLAYALRLYDNIVVEGLKFHESQPALGGKRKKRIGHNLLLRLKHYKTETLRFLTDPDVPFTNNQAEQDIRMMKVKQKISGSFRTSKGAQNFCIIRGFLSTQRKQGNNLFLAVNTAIA
jgi:transposase